MTEADPPAGRQVHRIGGAAVNEAQERARAVLAAELAGEAVDPTRRREALAVVLDQVDRLEAMLENTTDMITVLGEDGTIRYSNRAAGTLTGHGEEVNGKSSLELVHPDDVETAAAALRHCLTEPGAEVNLEVRIRHADGTWHVVDAYAKNCLSDPVAGLVVSGRDISERKAAEEALRSANEALRAALAETEAVQAQLVRRERLAAVGEAAATLAHELRNPLGVISNALYLLRERLPDEGFHRSGRHLETAEREVAVAAGLVSGLLDYAEIRRPVMAPLDLVELMEEVIDAFPAPRGISVDWHPPAGVPAVPGDRRLLRQALVNLVANAADAMPTGGTLGLGVAVDEAAVRVAVSDTGTGITEDVLPRVFEPFFTAKIKGTGLGLAVVERIVAAHDGLVTVDTAPGRGSTFTVHLPLPGS